MQIKKLYIHDSGDPSVGVFPTGWEADVPMYIPDSDKMSDSEKEDIEFFRKQILDAYEEFAEGKLWAMYDFELKTERERY